MILQFDVLRLTCPVSTQIIGQCWRETHQSACLRFERCVVQVVDDLELEVEGDMEQEV